MRAVSGNTRAGSGSWLRMLFLKGLECPTQYFDWANSGGGGWDSHRHRESRYFRCAVRGTFSPTWPQSVSAPRILLHRIVFIPVPRIAELVCSAKKRAEAG